MSDCKTCKYLDRFNCCCSNEPIMTCKAEMEEHDSIVRSEMLGEVIKAIDESNYCVLEDCPFYKQCGYHLCPLDSNGLTIIQNWLEKWMEHLKEK